MAANFLRNDALPDLLELLATFGELHGPVLSDDGVPAFRPVSALQELHVDYRRTLLPPKKYLLPPRETVLTFAPGEGYRQPSPPRHDIILFGLHLCDLQGIAYLDMVFMGDNSDPLYLARRKALTLVGLSCAPDDYCFCGN